MGDTNHELKSSNQQMFQPYNYKKIEEVSDLRDDLRSNIFNTEHHFVIGNEKENQFITVNHHDYLQQNPDGLTKNCNYLKLSHVNLGDRSQEYINHYETTNNRLLSEKNSPIMQKYNNINLRSSIDLKEDKDTNYISENKSK
jgi:hypothetical protein